MSDRSQRAHRSEQRRASAAALAGTLLALTSAMAAHAQSIPAATHQLQSTGRSAITPNATIGWDFQVTREIVVTDLGFFDMLETTSGSIGDGLFEPHAVGIWDEGGTLLVSGVVAGGTAAPLEAGFRYVAVPDTTLQPGETYIIGAHFPSTCDFTIGGAGDCSVTYAQGGIMVPPKFAWDDRVYPIGRRSGVGFAAPLVTGTNPAFGPSFKFELGAAPPPPPPAPPGETVLTDPLGDFTLLAGPLPPGSPNPPDLLEVRAGFDATHLHVDVEFAPGTMQPGVTGTFYVLGLDLDLNPLTGGSFVPGADATLLFATSLDTATICDGSLWFCGASVPVTHAGDTMQLSIPLDASGLDDDGAVRFGFVAGLFVDGSPATEDAAFGGASGSLARVFAAVSGNLLAVEAVPGLGGVGGAVLVGLVVAMGAWRGRRG